MTIWRTWSLDWEGLEYAIHLASQCLRRPHSYIQFDQDKKNSIHSFLAGHFMFNHWSKYSNATRTGPSWCPGKDMTFWSYLVTLLLPPFFVKSPALGHKNNKPNGCGALKSSHGVLYLRINITRQYKLQPSYVVLSEYKVACCRKAINVCCEKKINKKIVSFFFSFFLLYRTAWIKGDLDWGKDCEYVIHSVWKGREDAENTLSSQSLTRVLNKRRHWGIHKIGFLFVLQCNCNAGRRVHQLLQHQHAIETSIVVAQHQQDSDGAIITASTFQKGP
jgi:hypothetical protein